MQSNRNYKEELIELLKTRMDRFEQGSFEKIVKRIPDSDLDGALDPRVHALKVEEAKAIGGPFPEFPPHEFPLEAIRSSMGYPNKDITRSNVGVERRIITGKNGPIPIRIYTPSIGAAFHPIVYFHGGGFIGGSLDTVENPCKSLAEKANAVVVSVDYRLAPEHPFPAGLTDCYDAVEWVCRHAEELHADRNRLAVAGDSAGGNLANGCSMMDRDLGHRRIRYQALIYPVVKLAEDESFAWNLDEYEIEHHRDMILQGLVGLQGAGETLNRMYVQEGSDPRDPYASPLLCSQLEGMPRTLIVTAEYDMLRLEGEEYARRLGQAGVETRLIRYKGMDHAFIDKYGIYPQAEDCMDEIADDVRSL